MKGTVRRFRFAKMGTVPITICAVDTPAPAPSLAVNFCGLRFDTPIVLLSGCVGFGEEYTRVAGFTNRDAGADSAEQAGRAPGEALSQHLAGREL